MDIDKRDKAADQYAFGSDNDEVAYDAFCDGADWLMEQPLSERLTESELTKIKAYYDGDTFGELDFLEIVSTRRVLKSIFGNDLFIKVQSNEKTIK